jgi:hypothetical protein
LLYNGKPWWNEVDRGKFLIRAPELCGNPTSSHLVARRRNLGKEMMNLPFKVSLFILRSDILHAIKSYGIGHRLYSSLKEGVM